MPRRLRWSSGILIGLAGAATAVIVLLVAGLLSGRGPSVIADAGGGMLPRELEALTGLAPAAAYLVVHTAFYLIAGIAAVILARLADRFPPIMTGLLLVMIIVEFGFFQFSTEMMAAHHIDQFTWRALLLAHAAADAVFILLLLRVHPSLRQDAVKGYEF
jgi:hypothetical protein